MPANPLQTIIAIGGKLQASLPQAVRQANLQLMSLNRTTTQVNQNMASMGRRIAGGLLSLGGLYGVIQIGRQGVQLAQQEQDVRMALSTLITNQNNLRGVSIEQSRQQVALLERQAELYQDQSGIYSTTLLKGAAYLAQYKLTAQQIEQIQPAMAEILNYQRLMGRSASGMSEIYTAVGRAMMGQARGLKAIGVELTAQQQMILKANYQMGRYAENARIIAAEIQREHGGATVAFMGTLEGQSVLAMTRIQESIKEIGRALLPIVELGQIILSKLIQPLTSHFEDLNRLIMSHWREWVRYLDTQIIPTWTRWVDTGWKAIVTSVQWLIKNSSWLLPIVKTLGIAFLVWNFALGPIAGFIGALLNPLTMAGTIAAVIGASLSLAGAQIIEMTTNAKEFLGVITQGKEAVGKMKDWLLGSDAGDGGFRRRFQLGGPDKIKYQEGVLPKLMGPIGDWAQKMKAKIGDWFQSIRQMVANWITDVLGMVAQNIIKWMGDQWNWLDQSVDNWIDQITAKQRTKLLHFFDPAIEGVKLVGQAIIDWILSPITNVNTAWQAFQQSLDPSTWVGGGASGASRGVGGGWGGAARPFAGGPPSGFTPSPTDMIRAETYGPRSQGATSADMSQLWGATVAGHKIPLQTGVSAGISPSMLPQYPIGSWVDEYIGGKLVRHRRVDDTSWIKSGVPTRGTVENYNDIDLGRVQLKRSPNQGPDTPGQTAAAQPVTINYNVGGMTIHATDGDDMQRRLEAAHRRHIDALTRQMEEVVYGNNRKSFDSGSTAL